MPMEDGPLKTFPKTVCHQRVHSASHDATTLIKLVKPIADLSAFVAPVDLMETGDADDLSFKNDQCVKTIVVSETLE